ncbi:uncharacterized protein LOC142985538 [Anticarsia gemmatalis]|uniref:uncharacterized protein LOC142985538 n=1 Tax=Anticarsia gemmatalis TaxID=129554 RepID=UPI003F767131
MILRRRPMLFLLLALAAASAEETPPGLVSKDSEQDLVAEATHSGSTAQKREAPLSNSYGEPLPPDAYGPPKDLGNTISDLQLPAPVYGVPDLPILQTPPGAYGPPSPVNFPSQVYHGPPPPISKPKPIYGPPKYSPPKPIYGPPKLSLPKPVYGPPKKTFGPPKQSLPKPTYGVPFKPPKIVLNKPIFSPPKPVYGPPKPVYGPPKINYGPPSPLPLPELPSIPLPPVENNHIDVGLNLPAPIYGTPLVNLPVDLKPNFPIPSDTYGPPGQVVGPIGPNDQVVFGNVGSISHYGPPQPDPNPRPPHPGIPAPPTPPHVLYDGWKPIPGVSQPIHQIGHEIHQQVDQHIGQQIHQQVDQHIGQEIHQHVGQDHFANDIQLNLDQSLPNLDSHNQFSSAQITTGYANVHQDALANIDLNAIVGGDSNGIDQSKTVFEAHYTENRGHQADLAVGKPFDTYGAPPLDSFSSSGPYPASLRQQGAKGLVAPSGFYGVPLGSQYGAPPRHSPNLPLPYGYHSGGGHTGLNSPQKPIKFRESVPEGLFEGIGHVSQHKDAHHIDHVHQGPAYLPPPIRDIKDVNIHSGNAGLNSVSLSIEPTNLYSLPHNGNPISFQQQQVPSNLYGSPIDSYAAPLLTVGVGDHVTSGSSNNAITSTIDGTLLANLSSLDAAAILKHCPYHEAILKAAQSGEKIPVDLATSYVNSLSSLGTTLKSSNTVIPNSFAQDLVSAHSVIHQNNVKNEKRESYSQKGKALNSKHVLKDERLQFVSDQIQKTSERINSLNLEAKELQQKIAASNQHIREPIPNKIGQFSIQIQGSNNQKGKDGVPHEQLLSEGLLQSILQAIEDPNKPGQNQVNQQSLNQHLANQHSQNQLSQSQIVSNQPSTNQHVSSQQQTQQFTQQNAQFFNHIHQQSLPQVNYQNFASFHDGLVLPDGYEPIDHSKDQATQASEVHAHKGPCDLKTAGSERSEVVVPPPESIDKDDNEVAIYFDEKEAVTEISVATSISEEESSGKSKA